MKTKVFLIIVVTVLLGVGWVQADTVWLSGHHEIVDGNVYGEIYIYNDVTLDILGGDIYKLETYDLTLTDWYAGEMNRLYNHDDSTVNIFGGTLYTLEATENSLVYLYAYDVTYDPTGGGYGNGWIEGTYYSDDSTFGFSLFSQDTYSHIIVASEPVMDAEIDIQPNTLNLSSKGKWINCRIWLPEDYNVADIEPNSVVIENEPNDIYPEWLWFNEKQNVIMAKFPRSELEEILEPGEVELTVTGHLVDGTYFQGTDTIRVTDKGRLRGRRVNSNSKVVDGIEYYIQTDKSLYRLGESVEMLYKVTNLTDQDVVIACDRAGEFNFWVQKDGETIWALYHWFVWYSPGVELLAGESTDLPPYNWDMKDDNGNLVEPGIYNVVGVMYNGPWNYYNGGSYTLTEVGVPIKIIPEPKGRVKHK